ncbi:MAG: hypothetical protein A2792_04740 [Sphingomonadales bacterium RIFCSPHIGHO2_01_FULL_65_20]|uniref:hypothetical protein n=1 Tax=Blastomonas sp. TaxID=1909299 RepID=UPI0008CB0435|nr:hypothetical protein [Blastomonas sp.]OHC97831.1 MAG: hypothetical protein A2792_04740 [Sphingomonadales bacterium RIFCSPHIGHO2_01_FULL_65_20]
MAVSAETPCINEAARIAGKAQHDSIAAWPIIARKGFDPTQSSNATIFVNHEIARVQLGKPVQSEVAGDHGTSLPKLGFATDGMFKSTNN